MSRMKDIFNLVQEVIFDCKTLNIPIDECADVQLCGVGEMGINSVGNCTRTGVVNHRDTFRISLNMDIFSKYDDMETPLRNTIAHEFLHTCVGCFNHGKLWKEYARLLRCKGYDVTTKSLTHYSVDSLIDNKMFKYVVNCNGCGYAFGYKRKTKVISFIQNPSLGYIVCTCGCKDFTLHQNY